MSSLFIGLVTYRATHYPQARGRQGLASRLSRALCRLGVQTTLQIHDQDLGYKYHSISSTELSQSRSALAKLQKNWLDYLQADTSPHPRQLLKAATMRIRRTLGLLEPRDIDAAYRLLNIELAHLSLMEMALSERTQYSLILEDDGDCEDADELARWICDFLHRPNSSYLVNLSASFSLRQMGLYRLVNPASSRVMGNNELAFNKPVTNTACAIMYSLELLETLVPRWRDQRLIPIVPIDWRLNGILMELYRDKILPPGTCLVVDPGPVVQQSLHGSTIRTDAPY